jgi:hypothetical protein
MKQRINTEEYGLLRNKSVPIRIHPLFQISFFPLCPAGGG